LEGLSESLTPQLEDELLGFDNCEAGALLLQKWNFSNDLTRPIKFQNVPKAAAKDESMAALLMLTKQVIEDLPREKLKGNFAKVAKTYEPDAKLMNLLTISQEELFEGLKWTVEEFDKLSVSLKD
jgi:HD-like signal output (HDOD) protein